MKNVYILQEREANLLEDSLLVPVGYTRSSRIEATETYLTDYTHPTAEGYHQIADSIYAALKSI